MKATNNSTSSKAAKPKTASMGATEAYAAGKQLAAEFVSWIRKSNDESIEMKAIGALERLRDIARGPVALSVHQGFCEGVMESRVGGDVKTAAEFPSATEPRSAVERKNVNLNRRALCNDLQEIACVADSIRRLSASNDPVAIRTLAEKAGCLADRWLPRLGDAGSLVVGDKFEDWMSAQSLRTSMDEKLKGKLSEVRGTDLEDWRSAS